MRLRREAAVMKRKLVRSCAWIAELVAESLDDFRYRGYRQAVSGRVDLVQNRRQG